MTPPGRLREPSMPEPATEPPPSSSAAASAGGEDLGVVPQAQQERPTCLFVLPWELRESGGVSQVVENLFDATVRANGYRSLLLVKTWGVRKSTIVSVDGRRTVRLTIASPQQLLSFMWRLPITVLRLRRLVVDEVVSRVNVHYPGLDALTWLLVRRLVRPPLKLVLSFHGSDLRDARATAGWKRRLWSVLLHGADDITACSEQLRAALVESFAGAARHARAVANGVEPHRIAALARSAPAVALPRRFLLSLATIERKKGLDTLTTAFARLAAEFPDLHLVLAGRVAEPDYFDELQAQWSALPCSERIVCLQDLPHAEAMRVLARATALALPSRQEPFGIVVLEAGVLAVPVVATAACGVVGLLEAESEVIVVPPDDATALAQGLARLLCDEALARRLGRALQGRALRDFTWQLVAPQYERRDDDSSANAGASQFSSGGKPIR